jgi:hypothetical protein
MLGNDPQHLIRGIEELNITKISTGGVDKRISDLRDSEIHCKIVVRLIVALRSSCVQRQCLSTSR